MWCTRRTHRFALSSSSLLFSWWRGRQERKINTPAAAQTVLHAAAESMGWGGGTAAGFTNTGSGGSQDDHTVVRRLSGVTSASPSVSAAVPKDFVDELLLNPSAQRAGSQRVPITYEMQVHAHARAREAQMREMAQRHSEKFDENNMPKDLGNPYRQRESWEFTPTPEHKSLVLLLYRNIIKGLMDYKSIRKRSMIAYTRFCFRRRATATEKLLVDECIEEARRAIYVLDKHHTFTRTRTYEYDSMSIPKDTGQDVKTYMEEVYDPEVSRQQFQHFTDVQPGKEDEHRQGFGPTGGKHHWKSQTTSTGYTVEIRDEDKALRPPPPPGMEAVPSLHENRAR